MKRRNNRIEFQETGRYLVYDISEFYYYKYFKEQAADFVEIVHLTAYQICNVYTNKDTPIEAYMPVNGKEAEFKMVLDHNRQVLAPKQKNAVLDIVRSNVKYNCHGLSFLDRMFWFTLNNETLELILEEDNYKECTASELKENGVALYYRPNGDLYHSARVLNGNLISKFGVNHKISIGEEDLKRFYRKNIDLSKSRYFNP